MSKRIDGDTAGDGLVRVRTDVRIERGQMCILEAWKKLRLDTAF